MVEVSVADVFTSLSVLVDAMPPFGSDDEPAMNFPCVPSSR